MVYVAAWRPFLSPRSVPRHLGVAVNGSQTWTAYAGANAFADFSGSGALLVHYLYGLGMDTLLARVDASNNTAFYLTDNLGSVRQVVSASGSVLDTLSYDTFGNILSETNSGNGDRFKYTSREWNAELGLYYFRARYYNPSSGAYLSEDPAGFRAGDSNLHRYVGNASVIHIDPTGLWSWSWSGAGSGAVVGAGVGAFVGTFVFPGVGTGVGAVTGAAAGAVIGGIAGGLGANSAAEYVAPQFHKDHPIVSEMLAGGGIGVPSGIAGPALAAFILPGASAVAGGSSPTLATAAAGGTVAAQQVAQNEPQIEEAFAALAPQLEQTAAEVGPQLEQTAAELAPQAEQAAGEVAPLAEQAAANSAATLAGNAPIGSAITAARQQELLNSATQAGCGGLSEAGRALQSHATREGSWLAGRSAGGNATLNTAAARQALQEILTGGQTVESTHPVWGQIVTVRLPDGAGAVWKSDGTFVTFLERFTPR